MRKWRLIKPGYRIDSNGIVQSNRSGRWRNLRPRPQAKGHLSVDVGHRDMRYVGRLVLEAFVGPAPRGWVCGWRDGNLANCRLSNLRWRSRREARMGAAA